MNEYENYDVRRLIEGCRNREDFAFAELVGRYTPMMNKVIHSFSESDQSYDDMFVEATVALHTATLKFDMEQSSVTFGLFARICVHHRLVDYVRSSRRDPEIVDYDIDLLSDNEELEAGIVTRETVRGLLKGAEKILSDFEYKVLLLHIQGYKTAAIAKVMDRTPKSVDNAKYRIFSRLRKEYGNGWEI